MTSDVVAGSFHQIGHSFPSQLFLHCGTCYMFGGCTSRFSFYCVCLLAAKRPSNRLVYLRDGSAQTILRATTLR